MLKTLIHLLRLISLYVRLVILAQVVQTLDSEPLDNATGFPNTYPLASDIFGG